MKSQKSFSHQPPQRRRRPVGGSPSSSFHDRPREVRGETELEHGPIVTKCLRSITSQCQVHIHYSVLALALIVFSGLHARESLVLCCVTRGCDRGSHRIIYLIIFYVTLYVTLCISQGSFLGSLVQQVRGTLSSMLYGGRAVAAFPRIQVKHYLTILKEFY